MSALALRNLRRKPFYATEAKVTADNMQEIANWCGGEVIPATDVKPVHIKVPTLRVQNERQSTAFVGDSVLKVGRSFKVFTKEAVESTFEDVTDSINRGPKPSSGTQNAMWTPEQNAA